MSHYELLDSPFALLHHRRRALGALFGLLCTLVWPGVSLAQLDLCGCIGHPQSLGAFDADNTATYPPGTTQSGNTLTIPLPGDGMLIFSSFTIPSNRFFTVRFARNAANTPVTLLVSGNVTLGSNNLLDVSGDDGTYGVSGVNGVGGLGGTGGFPGGDGAYQLVNLVNNGGTGVGPGGGSAGTASPLAAGSAGSFLRVPELLPLVGGSGGGGGASASNALGCSGGGGGGGGGALLLAANGTLTVNGQINADGGFHGSPGVSTCASDGGAGSGGAIRLVANAIAGAGSVIARAGDVSANHAGTIRLEALSTNTLSANSTNPVALRVSTPGPLTNPLAATVEITQVGGQTVPTPPRGVFRETDVILQTSGLVSVRLATSGVPSGTAVNVTAKPRVGGAPILQSASLAPANCTTAGDCDITVTMNLPAGAHVLEAQATFQP